MNAVGEPDVVVGIRGALERSDVVASVVLGGSRARGTATELSDWDFYLKGHPEEMTAEIPTLVASLGPLAATTITTSVDEAVISYRRVRAQAQEAFGAGVDPELGRQISEALAVPELRHGHAGS